MGSESGSQRLRLLMAGRVQGVFFRASTQDEARRLGVSGTVRNLPDGRVEVVAEGAANDVEALARWCQRGPPMAQVRDVERLDEPPRNLTGPFVIC